MTAIDGEHAELSIGGVSVTHSIGEITRTWFGDFLMLWRPPTGSAVTLSRGSQGPAVAWLRDSLAAIDDRYADNDALPDVLKFNVRQGSFLPPGDPRRGAERREQIVCMRERIARSRANGPWPPRDHWFAYAALVQIAFPSLVWSGVTLVGWAVVTCEDHQSVLSDT